MRVAEIEDALSTDADLVKSTLSGDNSAFEKLVERYQRKVYRLAHRIVNSSFDASDIVQETFVKAYKGLAYLKDHDRFSSWLYQIAKNHCTDWLRKRRDDLISIEKEIGLDRLNLPAAPDEILIEKELHEQIMKAISELPPHSRKAVQMFYIDGKSYAEIQEELGVKKGTLARWLYEARLKLSKVSQQFSFIFISLLRRAFYQLTAVSIFKCLIISIILHAIIFSQIELKDTSFTSSHGRSYHNAFVKASLINDVPVENLSSQMDKGGVPIARAGGISDNAGLKRFDIDRHKNSIISVPPVYPETSRSRQRLPLSEPPYSIPQLLSDAGYRQYSAGYKLKEFSPHPIGAGSIERAIELDISKQNQPVFAIVVDPETSDNDTEIDQVITQAGKSNEYELVRSFPEKPDRSSPFGLSSRMAVDSQGNIYVSDLTNHRIVKLSPDGEVIASWGGKGYNDGQLKYPCGIAVDNYGNVYVADSGNRRIHKFDSSGKSIVNWGDKNYIGSQSFKKPVDVALDDSGYIYVVDAGNNCIYKLTPDGRLIQKLGVKGSKEGRFRTPTSIAIDKSGNIYVADGDNHRIQKFTQEGAFTAKWGTMGTGDGKFRSHCEVAIDNYGDVLVADWGNCRVQKFGPGGNFLTKWGKKIAGYDPFWRGGKEEPYDGFMLPYDIAVDDQGNVYVLDGWRIKVFRQKVKASTK